MALLVSKTHAGRFTSFEWLELLPELRLRKAWARLIAKVWLLHWNILDMLFLQL